MRWPSSFRYYTRLDVPTSPSEQLRVETALGYARFALAVLAIMAVVIDATEPGIYARLVYLLLTLWMLYSACVIGWLKTQGITPRSSVLLHILDVAWPASITLFTHGPSSPFFPLFAFAQIGAAFRWGFPETIATSIFGVAMLDMEALYLTGTTKSFQELLTGEFEINRLIIRCSYLVAIGFLVGTLGENAKERRAESGVIARVLSACRPEVGLAEAMRAVFTEFQRIFDCTRAYLISVDQNTDQVFVWHGTTVGTPEQEPYVTEELDANVWLMPRLPRVFAAEKLRDGHFWMKALAGQDVKEREIEGFPEMGFHSGPIESLLCCSSELGHEWKARLILVNGRLGENSEQELRFCDMLLKQAMSAVYSVYLVRRLRDRAGAMERARVARELHDGAIQSLISAEMRVDVLRRSTEKEAPGMTGELTVLQDLLRQEVLNLRELMQQMKPVDLGPQQLTDFMADAVDRFRRDSGVGARFVSDLQEDVFLTPYVCGELVRILQESLVNVRKHASATNVIVTFSQANDSYLLTIADNGKGFEFAGKVEFDDLLSASKAPTVIRERVHGIGGRMSVESSPGHGSRLEIMVVQKGQAPYGEQERKNTNPYRG